MNPAIKLIVEQIEKNQAQVAYLTERMAREKKRHESEVLQIELLQDETKQLGYTLAQLKGELDQAVS